MNVLYPLTHPQKRIWYMEKIYPCTSLYNIGGPVRIKGTVDFEILEEAIDIFIKNNEGLRLQLVEYDGEVRQYVSDYERMKLDFVDFSNCDNPEREFQKWVEKEARIPFPLENSRLFKFVIFKISETDNGYLTKFHHIIADGWSINLMTEQISSNYMYILNNQKIDNNSVCSYIEYINNEFSYLSSHRLLKNKAFWNEKFKILPETFLNKSSDDIKGKRKTYELDSILSQKIKDLIANMKGSLNTFFVALYLIYINKTTHQEDLTIGIPVLNRSGKREKNMFGMFTSTMPFRFHLDSGITVIDTMQMISKELMRCYFHQKYPYDLLVQDLNLRKKGYDNLFNACVNYYNTELISELNGIPIENLEVYNGYQIYSIQLVIKEWSKSGNLTLDFDYKINDYSDGQIDVIYGSLVNMATQMIHNPGEQIENINLLSEDQRKELLYEFNATAAHYPGDKTIYQLFEEQVERVPNKVAICFHTIELTYRELNEKSNQLARYLVNKGVQREVIVGLLTTHAIETVIGILGIVKAGGAYLPINPDDPQERIRYILQDTKANLLLTNLQELKDFNFVGEIIHLNHSDLYRNETSNLEVRNKPGDLVYVIYTSGSTGNPKGTMIEQQGLVNYIWWAKKTYALNEDETFPLYSALSFDLTVTSIFTPLISGNRIIVYSSNDEDEYVLYRILKENQVTVIKLTPSHLSLIKDMDHRHSSIRRLIVGGEDLKASLASAIYESFGGEIEIFNEYGPTETVVGCMVYQYNYESDTRTSVPIGKPIDNVQVYVFDQNLNPLPLTTAGELYISGDGVARGYINRPELTKEKFIVNPFEEGKRMYTTGDIVRFIDSSRIEYIGRADQQVKIRGYRIELGEIENCLIRHEAIKDAVLVDLEDTTRGKFLCAYVVKRTAISTNELKAFLLCHLPDYMVPSYFIDLDTIPLSSNGKVNRDLLPKPEIDLIKDSNHPIYQDEKEEILVNVICEVLNIEKVSMEQNFYYIGGDSIKAIQMAAKLSDKGWKIKVKDILSHPIIAEMSLYVESNKERAIKQDPCSGAIKRTPIVSWFLSNHFAHSNYFNQTVLLELTGRVTTHKLGVILNKLIQQHDSLRINYNRKTGELFYNEDHLKKEFRIGEYDLSDLPCSRQYEQMAVIAERYHANFNLENDLLLKACVFNFGPDERKLFMVAHHLVIDGVSWRIILEDINTMMGQMADGQKIVLPNKTNSYQDWAEMLDNYSKGISDGEKRYWEAVLGVEFSFPIDHVLGPDTVQSSDTRSFELSEEESKSLLQNSNRAYNTEPVELLVTAFMQTIQEWTGKDEMVIELEGHGREDLVDEMDLTRTVGWFTSVYPFYARLNGNDLSLKIKTVKEGIRQVPSKGVSFGVLKYLCKTLGDNEQKYIRFNYLGDFATEYTFLKFQMNRLTSHSDPENILPCLIEVNCYTIEGKLMVLITYSKNRFTTITIESFGKHFMHNLQRILTHCQVKEGIEFTPSDFTKVNLSQEELERLFG